MVRLARLLVFVLCTLVVWLSAKPAFASGALCDDDGASTNAPTPLLIAAAVFIDAAPPDGVIVEETMVTTVVPTHGFACADDAPTPCALPPAVEFTKQIAVPRSPLYSSTPLGHHSGVEDSLDRPPR